MLLRPAPWRAALAAAGLAACITPPALMPGAHVDADLAPGLYPARTERVAIAGAQGERLRGLFVPAGEGAPVVLHLLESSGSAASLKYHYAVLCRQLRDVGLASLLVDYRGVGASDGDPSPRHLREDARAMWGEAVARAGGDPRRVVLRGISLGTIAAALLLEEGAEPGAVLLHVPVEADTAVRRFAQASYGGLVAWLADLVYADLADVDLDQQLAQCRAPLLVFAGDEDLFLTDRERARLAGAVQAAGGAWHAPFSRHAEGTLLAHELAAEELELLVARFPPPPLDGAQLEALVASLPPEVAARFREDVPRARLAGMARLARHADPVLRAAVALADEPDLDALRYLWHIEERGELRELPFDELVGAVALDGGEGRLPVGAIEEAARLGDFDHRYGGGGASESVGLIVERVRTALADEGAATVTYTVDIGWDRAEIVSDARAVVARLRADGFQEQALERAAVRVLLEANRIPERVRRASDGRVVLEVREEDAWRELDLAGELPPRSFRFNVPAELGARARALVEARERERPALEGE